MILTVGGAKPGQARLKCRSILKAFDIPRQRIEDHNLSDAINMGFWFAAKDRFAGKTDERVR